MKTRTDIISLDNQTSNVYKVTLSGREYTAVGVSDDHVIENVSTPDRDYTPPTPSPVSQSIYSIVPNSSSVDEGTSLSVSIVTNNVSTGTSLYWSVTNGGDFITSSDQVTINNNSGQFDVTPIADFTTEGPESFYISLRTGSTNGPIVAQSSALTINDTSITPPPPVPAYAISADDDNVDEGSLLNVTVTTENVTDGTVLYWNLTNPSDFNDGTGEVTITGNSGQFFVSPTADGTTEGPEAFTIILRLSSGSGIIVAATDPITINDTSTEVEPEQPEQPEPEPEQPEPAPEGLPSLDSPTGLDTGRFLSNVVYNQPFDPRDDITVSFLYSSPSIDTGDNLLLEGGEFDQALFELQTSGDFLVLNSGEASFNGLGVFLIDGSINTLTGGGAGSTDVTLSSYDPGIGMVTDTTTTASSAISGFIAAVALDQSGAFGKQNSLEQFTTGTASYHPGNIVTRTFNSETSTFPFKGSETPSAPTVVEESFNIFRVGFKRRLQDIVFYKKEGNIYEPDVSFTTDIALSAIPESVKIGFTYSGTKPTDLKNIAVNGNNIV